MKVLVTGANGFVGIHLVNLLLAKGYEVIATGTRNPSLLLPQRGLTYQVMDFTDPFAVHDVFEEYQPEVVVHAGALSMVDFAEENQWNCYTTNVEGTLTLLSNAAPGKSFFIFISTDFVFRGDTGNYIEEDDTAPVNFYGKTKAEAEEAVKEYENDWAIVRTSLVYGKPVSGKHNIVSLVADKLKKGEEYGLVNDQFRSPTYVGDLSKGIAAIIEKKAKGIFHIAGKDILSPFQVGMAVAGYLNADMNMIAVLNSANFKQTALRPLKTNLSIEKAKKDLHYQPVSFEEGLGLTLG